MSESVSFDVNRNYGEPRGLSCLKWQPLLRPNPRYRNEVEVNFLRSGAVTYLLGGQKVTVQARRICLFWRAIPHQIIGYQKESSCFVGTIALQTFLQWRLPDEFVQSLLHGQLISKQTDDANSDTNLLERWMVDLEGNSRELSQLVSLEMRARLTQLASGFSVCKTDSGVPPFSCAGLTKVEQMAYYISQNYTQKITVHQVAESVNLNPNYAMSLFHKTFSSTLLNCLTRHRLSHAQRLLVTSNESIASIFLLSGFQSISRFNDVFNRAVGCSPREYRKIHARAESDAR